MNILFIGAGAFAREALESLPDIYRVIGYVSEISPPLPELMNQHKLKFADTKEQSFSIFNSIGNACEELGSKIDAAFVAIFDVHAKKRLVEALDGYRVPLVSIIDPAAQIADLSLVGAGCYVGPLARLSHNLRLGRCVAVSNFCALGHDNDIGDFCSFGPFVSVTTGVNISSSCLFGVHSAVMPNTFITDNVTIAPGSVVYRDVVEAGSTFLGNPAKRVR